MSNPSPVDPEEHAAPAAAGVSDVASVVEVSVPDPHLRTIVLIRWGVVLWLVALVVLLAVPSLRTDGREWWLWVPVAGVVLGLVGHAYLARGRGNARFA